MTEEERRLAALLQQAVPQPPHSMTAGELAAQVARRATATPYRFRLWLPAVAAACALLVVGATSVWLLSGRSTPAAPTAQSSGASVPLPAVTSASTSSRNAGDPSMTRHSASSTAPSSQVRQSASGTRSTKPTSSGPTRPAEDWSFQPLYGPPIRSVIVSGTDAVYGLERLGLDRFEPPYENLTAQVPVDPNANWPPLVTARALWQTVPADGAVTLRALDPVTLQEIGSVRLAAATPTSTGPQWTPVLAADADASTLFLGNANRVYSVNPVSSEVEQEVAVKGTIGGMAVSPDGARLYVGVNVQGSDTARLLVLDIRHGLSPVSDTPLGAASVLSLLATGGGVWATFGVEERGGGKVRFAPLNDLARTRVVVEWGDKNSATLAGGIVWIGGSGELVCADASTGTVRDRVQVESVTGLPHYIGSVRLLAGRWIVAYLRESTNGTYDYDLSVMTPPARCG
jgi:hypothetical protein